MINIACSNSVVAESFLAGFIGVEAGIDRNGVIRPEAKRFEKGVYEDLISLRDNGFCIIAGKRRDNYSGVRRQQIADATDEAIRALATSYGMSQIMGWHVINNLKCTISDLRDPQKHLFYTIRLLLIVSGDYLRRGDLESVLRIWNTGSANGNTYHAAYVASALKVKRAYEQVLQENKNKFKNSVPPVRQSSLDSETESDNPSPTFEPQTTTAVQDMGNTSQGIVTAATQTTIKTENVEVAATSPASSGESAAPAKSFEAFIPQIDTAKSWLKRLFSGGVLATVWAVVSGAPLWIQISLALIVIVTVIGGVAIFARYHKEIFAYVTAMNTLRATQGVDNPILTTEEKN